MGHRITVLHWRGLARACGAGGAAAVHAVERVGECGRAGSAEALPAAGAAAPDSGVQGAGPLAAQAARPLPACALAAAPLHVLGLQAEAVSRGIGATGRGSQHDVQHVVLHVILLTTLTTSAATRYPRAARTDGLQGG